MPACLVLTYWAGRETYIDIKRGTLKTNQLLSPVQAGINNKLCYFSWLHIRSPACNRCISPALVVHKILTMKTTCTVLCLMFFIFFFYLYKRATFHFLSRWAILQATHSNLYFTGQRLKRSVDSSRVICWQWWQQRPSYQLSLLKYREDWRPWHLILY